MSDTAGHSDTAGFTLLEGASPAIPVEYERGLARKSCTVIAERAIDEVSCLKFAKWRNHLDGVKSGPCPTYDTLVYQTSEGSVHRMDCEALAAGARCLTFMPSQTESVWTSDVPVEFCHFYLARGMLQAIFRAVWDRDLTDEDLSPFVGVLNLPFADLLETATTALSAPSSSSQLEIDAWGLLIGERLLRNAPAFRTMSKAPPTTCLDGTRLSAVIEFIEAELCKDVSLEVLASVAEMSAFHFVRAFRKATGRTPHQYVLERRLARAREMLATNKASLADIAYAVGFSSQAHMTDVFRKRLGITPGQYRKEVLL